MDVVVEDILARFGMLLSRSWGAKFGGVMKLDFTYAIIPIFGGEEIRLYRETRFVKTVTKNGASNSLVYIQEKDDFSWFMLHDNAELSSILRIKVSVLLYLPLTILTLQFQFNKFTRQIFNHIIHIL